MLSGSIYNSTSAQALLLERTPLKRVASFLSLLSLTASSFPARLIFVRALWRTRSSAAMATPPSESEKGSVMLIIQIIDDVCGALPRVAPCALSSVEAEPASGD